MDCSRFLSHWRGWLRPLVMGLYVLLLLVGLPLMIVEFHLTGTEYYHQAWFIGGFFVILAVPISLWGILQHIIHYTQPNLQRHIIRILWMVPIYAINAWVGLRFKSLTIYLDTAREFYEAYVIYNFMSFLLNFLNHEYIDLEATLEAKPQRRHLFPICCLPPWKMGRPLINNCKHGILQYTVVRLLTSVVAFVVRIISKDAYGEGDFSFTSAWAYLLIINNVSQGLAMYCLVLFYAATKEELAPMRPISKFMCIKAIVFFSFWQGVLVAILVATGVIKADPDSKLFPDEKDIANAIQDFAICIEMFLFAIAHYYSFSHTPYVDYAAAHEDCCTSFMTMWDVSDVRQDVVEHVRHVGQTAGRVVTRPLRGRDQGPVRESERTPLLQDNSGSGEESCSYLPQHTPPVHIDPSDLRSPVSNTDNVDNEELLNNSEQNFEGVSNLSESFAGRTSANPSMSNFAEFSETDSTSRASIGTSTEVKRPVEGDDPIA